MAIFFACSAFFAVNLSFGITFKPRFIPDPGVYDRLEVDNVTLGLSPNGEARLYLFNMPYNPSEYRLTTKDGRVYRYTDSGSAQSDSVGELIDVQDRNGNLLEFRDNGIFHSSGASITFQRDSAGRITDINYPTLDGGESTITYAYNPDGELERVTDAAGRFVTFEYLDAPNLHYLDKILDPDGNEIAVQTFDPATGRLDTITDGEGHVNQIFYDDAEKSETRVNTVTDVFGNTTSLSTKAVFNEDGNVVESVNERGISSFSVYGDPANPDLPTSVTPPCGCTTTFTYDDRGNVLTETKPGEETTIRTYDEQNNLLTETDALGRTLSFTFDEKGNQTSVTDQEGHLTRFIPDNFGRIREIVDDKGRSTFFEFDPAKSGGRAISKPTAIIRPDGSEYQFEYNTFGQATRGEDPSGILIRLEADEAGVLQRRIQVVDDGTGPREIVTSYGYNARGELETVTNPAGHVTSMEYDGNGKLRFRKFAPDLSQPQNQAVTEYVYDELGRIIKVIDPLNRETRRVYRDDGELIKIIQADNTEIAMEYDDSGNQTALVDPSGNRIEYEYDGNNRLTRKHEIFVTDSGVQQRTQTFVYDAVGNITEIIDRNGRVRKFEFDGNDRLTKEQWLSADLSSVINEINLEYDGIGNLIAAGDGQSNYVFEYDDRNLIEKSVVSYPGMTDFVLNYFNDDVAQTVTTVDHEGVTLHRQYDDRQQLVEMTWQGGGVNPASMQIDYTDLGDMDEIRRYKDASFGTLVSRTDLNFNRGLENKGFNSQVYNANGDQERLVGLSDTEGFGPLAIPTDVDDLILPSQNRLQRTSKVEHLNSSQEILQEFAYIYDQIGRMTQADENGENLTFSYDQIDQLQGITRTNQTDESYQYDDSGNRTTANGEGYSSVEHNRYETAGDSQFEYDAEGNLVGKTVTSDNSRWEYAFDHRNRLIKAELFPDLITQSPNHAITFSYDVFDRRISKTVDGQSTYFYHDGDDLWKQVGPDGSDTHYLYGGDHIDNLVAKHTQDEGTIWYLKDRLNTVRGLVDQDGNLINETEYTAYGEILENTDPAKADSFAFTGREFDKETGLYYYRARYYDPETGRFISRDPIETDSGDFNFYRYVENQPGFYVDPFGENASAEYDSFISRVSIAVEQCIKDLGLAAVENATVSGVYFLLSQRGVYAGRSVEIDRRHREHLRNETKGVVKGSLRPFYIKPDAYRNQLPKVRQLEQYLINLIDEAIDSPNFDLSKGNRRNEIRGRVTPCSAVPF